MASTDIAAQEKSFTGFLARGFVYSIIKSVDEEYATLLHDKRIAKYSPFSTTPFYTITRKRIVIYPRKVMRGTSFAFDVKILDDDLARIYMRGVSDISEVQLGKMGRAQLCSTSVKVVKLLETKNIASIPSKFRVSFFTPTYFRVRVPRTLRKKCRKMRTRLLPLPEPTHMFTNLFNLWNACFKHKVREEYLEWLIQYPILISRIKGLDTHKVYEHPMKGVFAIGFTGTVYYAFAEDVYDERMARITFQLLRLAEYSNVGGNRTAGFGWVKVRYPRK